jgi:hypothetical protein
MHLDKFYSLKMPSNPNRDGWLYIGDGLWVKPEIFDPKNQKLAQRVIKRASEVRRNREAAP